MRNLVAKFAAALVVAALVAGCSSGPLKTSAETAEGAQEAILTARGVVFVVLQEVNSQREAGIITHEEHAKYYQAIAVAHIKLNDAQLLLDSGDWQSARSQAELVRKVLVVLQREVHARARAREEAIKKRGDV